MHDACDEPDQGRCPASGSSTHDIPTLVGSHPDSSRPDVVGGIDCAHEKAPRSDDADAYRSKIPVDYGNCRRLVSAVRAQLRSRLLARVADVKPDGQQALCATRLVCITWTRTRLDHTTPIRFLGVRGPGIFIVFVSGFKSSNGDFTIVEERPLVVPLEAH